MKWFKHLSGSLNDSLIFEAIENFGSDAYLVFFGTLEILADEIDIYNPGKLSISLEKMKKNFQLSRQKIVKILSFFDQKAKKNEKKFISFYAEVGKTHVDIYCPKFERLCDEYTQWKKRKISGETTENLGRNSGILPPQNKSKNKNKNENVYVNPPIGGSDLLDRIILKCETIREFSEKLKKKINIYAWVQIALNNRGHPEAIIESMSALIAKWKKSQTVTIPWAYLNGTFQIKNGNYWEEEHIKESEKFKKIWIEDETIQELVGKIGNLENDKKDD